MVSPHPSPAPESAKRESVAATEGFFLLVPPLPPEGSACEPWELYAKTKDGGELVCSFPGSMDLGSAILAACRVQRQIDLAEYAGRERGFMEAKQKFAAPFELMLSRVTEFLAKADLQTRKRDAQLAELCDTFKGLAERIGQ